MSSLFDLFAHTPNTTEWADANWKFGMTLKQQGDHMSAVKYLSNCASFYQQIDMLATICDGIPPRSEGDVIKFSALKQGVEWKYSTSNDWCKWKFYDDLSLLAYYQNDFVTACKAYNLLLKHNNFPNEHRERILSNGRWIDDPLADQTYTNLHSTFSEIANVVTDTSNLPVVHFIYLKGYEFSLHHFIAISSAAKVLKTKIGRIHIYNDIQPIDNEWWNKVICIPNVYVISIIPPKYLNTKKVIYKAHQADIIRLCALKYMGGIYMDLDMMTLRDFSSELVSENDITLVQEDGDKYSNAFIYCQKDSKFLAVWMHEYETKWGNADIDSWGGLSVQFPFKLAQNMKEDINIKILPTYTFLPFDYFHTDFLTSSKSSINFSRSYAVHLWDTEQQKRGILPKTVADMKKNNSIYYQLFGKYVREEQATKAKYLISVEGNIGSGKSTLLDHLQNVQFKIPHIVVQEDVKRWTSFADANNLNIIQHYYTDQQKYGYTFQSLVLVSRMKNLVEVIKENPECLIFTERSYLTDQQIFAKSLYDKGYMTEIEWMTYNQCVQMLNHMITTAPDMIIYNLTSPDVCMQRIASRARKGEEHITQEYIECLHSYHNEWLLAGTNETEILFLDGDISFDTVQKNVEIQKIVDQINNKL